MLSWSRLSFNISKIYRHGLSRKLSLNSRLRCSVKTSAVGFDDYQTTWENFNLDVPHHFNFAEDVLEKWRNKELIGERSTDLPALWWTDDNSEIQWSFDELLQRSNRLCNVLVDCGIQQGDCVIVVLPTLPEWWLVNIACLKTGSILSPGSPLLTAKDLLDRLQASKAKCIITTNEVALIVDQISSKTPSLKTKLVVGGERKGWLPFDVLTREAPSSFQCVKTKSSDSVSWFFTSGTTGLPKMTEHTHASYGLSHQITGKYWLDLTEHDVMWHLSDTGVAKSAKFAPWWQGACIFGHHMPQFDVKKTLNVLKKYPVSVLCLQPTVYRLIMQEDLNNVRFKALRDCVSAGEPLNPKVIEKWKEMTTFNIREGYGQTEMPLCCGMFRCIEMRPGSMGKAAPGYDIRIINENGDEVAAHKEGEVAVKYVPKRPVGMFTQYVNDPERTAACFRGDYYLTGDRGYKDDDDYLWFVGRSDDVIISGGYGARYRIGPFEVESVLLEHPAVAESAVISSPCKIKGTVVKACIILSSDYKERDKKKLTEELQEHVKSLTASYKCPQKIEFVSTLPKTISGKIRRVELRRAEWLNNTT